ncbi:MAG: hypothetical protein K0B87_01935 [Candidatus Syntrophosphaera sp.]|nr:hypothetical protein [Candidatus Syntrophosphaera sp.]
MKKFFSIAILLLAVLGLMAQSPKQEALQSLDNAKAMLNQDNLVKAQDEINFALAKISEILAEQLEKYIPDAPAGFTQNSKESQSMGQAGAIVGSANSIIANASYSKDDMDIDLSITVGGVLGQTGGLMGMAKMFGGMGGSGKTIRVGGYTGNQDYDKGNKSGTLTIQVGNNITVMVEGDDIEDPEILKTFAELIDLAKLEKSF